ncbi:Lrp/AsnC family transcriptional regulator [Nonomuraea sp. NPDC003707]
MAYATLTDGLEIVCFISAPLRPSSQQLLQLLPRAAAVREVTTNLIIHHFSRTGRNWTAYGEPLSAGQLNLLEPHRPPVPSGPLLPPVDKDTPLLAALAEDGRATLVQLAEATGWSKARVVRRLEALESSGTLLYDVEVLPELLGHQLNAILWLQVASDRLAQVGEELVSHDEVSYAAATSGTHNIVASLYCRDTEDFYRYLTTRFAAVPGIIGYSVSIRVRRLKQATSLIEHGRLVPPPA